MQRRIPEFAPRTFKSWFKDHESRTDGARGKVILWADTFNNYFFPETAQSAAEVLEGAGFAVQVPQSHLCCGRPLYDYGFLDAAKGYLRNIMDRLRPEIEAGIPIVVLEPSCASVFRDELHGLFPDDPIAKKLKEQTFLLSELIENKKVPVPQLARKALVQGHCHHKSLLRFEDEHSVLGRLGLDFKVLASGCCGMAGSFGFENDKYEVSVDIGERVLLPAVRETPRDTLIIADGFSCREQIAQETEREALHLAEVLHMAQTDGAAPGPGKYAEAKMVKSRNAVRRRARVRAGLTLAAIIAGGLALRKMVKHR
jgi:Fe-S oxidoreductase